jgi:hypothetical protein
MKDQETHKIPSLLIFQFFLDFSRSDKYNDISEYYDIILVLVKRLNKANTLSNNKEMLNVLYELVKLNMNKRKNLLAIDSDCYYTIKFILRILKESGVEMKDLNE